MAFKILLERKCTATQQWDVVSNFRYSHDAEVCALLLSKLDAGKYRVVDQRWPDEGDEVTLYDNGELVA